MDRAISSLPVPVSPVMSTVISLSETLRIFCLIFFISSHASRDICLLSYSVINVLDIYPSPHNIQIKVEIFFFFKSTARTVVIGINGTDL